MLSRSLTLKSSTTPALAIFNEGECRHGQWPDGEKPKTLKQITEERRQQQETDANKTPPDLYRDEAVSNRKIKEAKLSTLPSLPLDEEHGQILKYSLHLEANKDNCVSWLQDPIILQWMKTIFAPVMKLNGLCSHLQPWTKPLPTPLRIEDGYLRLMLRGSTWSWRMLPLEDLRELSNH
jgi:hypothetical protein